MSPQFAAELADMRLLQTRHLLELLLEDADDESAIVRALAGVEDAHAAVRGLRETA